MRPERIDIGDQVDQVAFSPTGKIFVTTNKGKLACLDLAGVRLWEREWSPSVFQRLILRVAEDGRPWVGVGRVLIEIDHDGRDLKTLDLARDQLDRLGSFLLTDDGLYACLYRPGIHGSSEPTLTRVDRSGSTLWETMLPLVKISMWLDGNDNCEHETKPRHFWQPRAWCPIRYSGSEPLLLSGDRLMASFDDDLASGIGCSYGLDSGTGRLLWITEPAPTHTLAVAGPGWFYQGIQGYGAFETRLLGPDGLALQRWESHGYLVVSEGDQVRSVEMENRLPSRMRFVTLQEDGGVGEGPLLGGYYTTYAAISREGVVAFWRDGELVLIDDRMVKDVIYSDPLAGEQGVMSRMLLVPGGSLVFSIGTEVWIVDAGLGSLAESPWPCGGGNLRGNPAWI